MATSIKTKILLPRDTFAHWEGSSRVLQAGELVLAYDGDKFRLFEGNGQAFGENAAGVKELKLDAKQVVLSGDAEVTLQTAIEELQTAAGNALTAVSGTGTGVVTGVSQSGQTVSASFTNLAVTKTATAGSAIASVSQGANGQITAFTEISVLAASDVKIGYDSGTKKIVLSAAGLTSEVDATDFIKDGMLSAASYDPATHNIVLTFNTDAGTTPISVDVEALVDTYTATSSDTVGMAVTNNQFQAEVRDDSLTMAKFSPTETFLLDCGSATL